MGVTIESKNCSIDLGYGGFKALRTKVAELTAPDIYEHYKNLETGMILFGTVRQSFFDNYNAKIQQLSEKYHGEKDEILDFLYASDCSGEMDIEHCKSIYEIIKDYDDKQQAYRPVSRGESTFVEIKPNQKISIQKVEGYSDKVYISDSASIKPRALHMINRHTQRALEQWGIPLERKPKIVIVSPDEMPTAYGKYDAITNTVYYIPQIVDEKIVEKLGDVEYHEMWHMRQAENFRKKHGEIIRENYGKYIEYSCQKAKNVIDQAEINRYNVGEISDYAKQMYNRQRYDEVEAEYMVANRKKV